jgi:hypothetical protein
MTRLLRLLTVLILVGSFGSGIAVRSVGAGQGVALAAPPPLTVAKNEAVTKFPDGITFMLDAEVPGLVANIELEYREPGLDTWSVELPAFTPGATALDVTQALDLRAGQLPPGVDIDYRWRITEQNGDVLETPEQTVLWSDNRYDWTPLVGPHVTVYAYGADPAFQKAILDTAERTVNRLSTAYHATPDQTIRIWAYAARDDLYGALPPNSEPWIAGAAFPGLHLIMAILPPGNMNEVKRVVPHEISHQVLGQATENPFNNPPKWLDEGLAVYSQESGRDPFYEHALELAAKGQVPPLATLNGDFPYDHDGAMAAYAFSLSAVVYILDTWGDAGMARLIAAFPEGITYDDTIQQALGISFAELDRQWRADLIADAQRGDAVIGTPTSGEATPTAAATLPRCCETAFATNAYLAAA